MDIPSGFAQVNYIYSGSSCPTGAQWTHGVDISGYAGSPSDLGAQAHANYISEGLFGLQVTTCRLDAILVKFGPTATGPSALHNVGTTGSIGSQGISPQVSILVQKRTAFGGRRGRGRLYFPGPTESDVTNAGEVDSAYHAAAQLAFDNLLAEFSSDGMPWVLLHGGAGAPVPYDITSLEVSSTVATQRRRLRR